MRGRKSGQPARRQVTLISAMVTVLASLLCGPMAASAAAQGPEALAWRPPVVIDPRGEDSLQQTGLLAIDCPSTTLCVATDSQGNVVTTTDPTGGAAAWTVGRVDSLSRPGCVAV